MWIHLHPIRTPVHPPFAGVGLLFIQTIKVLTHCMQFYYTATTSNKYMPVYTCVKPGNKNQKLGTLGDFEFVVDYGSTISLDIVFKIS